jgi:endonuclease/exonuclease/phosphatase family metal-dependent hydrolase
MPKTLPIRVMTYNIRNSAAGDGPNAWPLRRQLWIEIARKFDPDLLGVQEVLADQYDDLRQAFPDYTLAGVAREDGDRLGEWSLILYRTDRFNEIARGDFWLSESPAVPGSKSWDAACCRLCSWVQLLDRNTEKAFRFANVHLDHVGKLAREKSAEMLLRELEQRKGRLPFILTGDFNSTEVDQPYKTLIRHGLIDSYITANPVRLADETTWHDFGTSADGLRIDWILHSPEFTATAATIDRTRGPDGRCGSDHDPVTAVLHRVDE